MSLRTKTIKKAVLIRNLKDVLKKWNGIKHVFFKGSKNAVTWQRQMRKDRRNVA